MQTDSVDGLLALYLAAVERTSGTGVSTDDVVDALAAATARSASSGEEGQDETAFEDAGPDASEVASSFDALSDAGYAEATEDGDYTLTASGREFASTVRANVADGTVQLGADAIPILEAVAEVDEEEVLVPVYRALGRAYSNAGALQAARDVINEARAHADEVGDAHGLVAATTDLARVYEAGGRFEDARQYYEQANYRATEAGLDREAANALADLGTNYYESGEDLDEARSTLEDALEAFRSVDDPLGECEVRRLLTTVSYDAGDFDAAREYGQQALDLVDGIDDEEDARFERGLVLSALGRVHTDAGEVDRAIDRLESAIDDAQGLHEVRARIWLADALIEAERLDEAEEQLDQSETRLDSGDLPEWLAPLLTARRGRIALERGDLDRAQELIEAINERGKELGAPRPIALSYYYDGLLQLEKENELWSTEYLGRAEVGGEEAGAWDIARKARKLRNRIED